MRKVAVVSYSLGKLMVERMSLLLLTGRAVPLGLPFGSLSAEGPASNVASHSYKSLFGVQESVNPSVPDWAKTVIPDILSGAAPGYANTPTLKRAGDHAKAVSLLMETVAGIDKSWNLAINAIFTQDERNQFFSGVETSEAFLDAVSRNSDLKAKWDTMSMQEKAIFEKYANKAAVRPLIDATYSQLKTMDILRQISVAGKDPETAVMLSTVYDALVASAGSLTWDSKTFLSEFTDKYSLNYDGVKEEGTVGSPALDIEYRRMKATAVVDELMLPNMLEGVFALAGVVPKGTSDLSGVVKFNSMTTLMNLIWDLRHASSLYSELSAPADKIESNMSPDLKAYYAKLKTGYMFAALSVYYTMQSSVAIVQHAAKLLGVNELIALVKQWSPEFAVMKDVDKILADFMALPVGTLWKELLGNSKAVSSIEVAGENCPALMLPCSDTEEGYKVAIAYAVGIFKFALSMRAETEVAALYAKGANLVGAKPLAVTPVSIKSHQHDYSVLKHGRVHGFQPSSIDDLSTHVFLDDGFNKFNSGAGTMIALMYDPAGVNIPQYHYGMITGKSVQAGVDAFDTRYRAGLGVQAFKTSCVPALLFQRIVPATFKNAVMREARLLHVGNSHALPYNPLSTPVQLISAAHYKTTSAKKDVMGIQEIPTDKLALDVYSHTFNTTAISDEEGQTAVRELCAVLGTLPLSVEANVRVGGIMRRFLSIDPASGTLGLNAPFLIYDDYFRAATNGFFYIPTSYLHNARLFALIDGNAAGQPTPLRTQSSAKDKVNNRVKPIMKVKDLDTLTGSVFSLEEWYNGLGFGEFPINIWGLYSSLERVAYNPILLPSSTLTDMTTKVGYTLQPEEMLMNF